MNNDRLRDFILSHTEEINNNDFKSVYSSPLYEYDLKSVIPRFTKILIDAGINPLLYMDDVPTYYAYKLNWTSVVIPNTVKRIGYSAFDGCTGLMSVTIPDSVTRIGYDAFYDCSSLTSVTIGNSVTSIGSYAFYNCTALTEIHYNATECADLRDSNYVFSYAGQDGTGITVTIGANVKKIPAYLFHPYYSSSYAPKITSVVFEEGSVCESIGNAAFDGCRGLKSITIPDSVTEIGDSAFEGCRGLTSVTIGNGVTSIGSCVFKNCKNLKDITFKGTTEQWEAISKGYAWDYNINEYTIHCIDGELKA